jgi:hypothetical protein
MPSSPSPAESSTTHSGHADKSQSGVEASYVQPAMAALYKIWLILIDGALALAWFAIVGVIAVAIGGIGHVLEPGLNAFGRQAFAYAENILLVIDMVSLITYLGLCACRELRELVLQLLGMG